jgi:GDPmannose 4,6-dehydratase
MLQQAEPKDFVIGTGESHTVQEFVEAAFSYVNLDWEKYVEIDEKYFRPTEVDYLLADISRAKKELGWEPQIKFNDLVKIMLDADMENCGLEPIGQGKKILKEKGIHWTNNELTVG